MKVSELLRNHFKTLSLWVIFHWGLLQPTFSNCRAPRPVPSRPVRRTWRPVLSKKPENLKTRKPETLKPENPKT